MNEVVKYLKERVYWVEECIINIIELDKELVCCESLLIIY